MGIDVASFGHQHEDKNSNTINDLQRLTPAQLQRLVAMKAAVADDASSPDAPQPTWRVEKKYHWTQTFPAHGTVHIRHEYTPVLGTSNMVSEPEYSSLCPSSALRKAIAKDGYSDSDPTGLFYVDFILTTANTWKTPIEDFTLIVERPSDGYRVNDVSLCWDGPVTKTDANHFSAHVSGLVPSKELRVGFIHSDMTRAQVRQNEQAEKNNAAKP
jgi:hypothetical protein